MWMQAIGQVVLTAALLWALDQNVIKGLSIHFKAGKTQVPRHEIGFSKFR